MRWTVRTRIAVDLIAAVSLSMIAVGFATLLAAKQLLHNNGAEMTEQLASSLAAQISRLRVAGRSLDHPDNSVLLQSFLAGEAALRHVELTVRSVAVESPGSFKTLGDDPPRRECIGAAEPVLRMANEPGQEAQAR